MTDDKTDQQTQHDLVLREELKFMIQKTREEFAYALRWFRIGIFVIGFASILAIVITVRLNQDRINDLQNQRRATISTSCRLQNTRHDRTIAKLDDIIRVSTTRIDPKGTAAVVALIDQILPISNCRELVKKSLGG